MKYLQEFIQEYGMDREGEDIHPTIHQSTNALGVTPSEKSSDMEGEAPTKPTKPPAPDLSARWGPGLLDDAPGISAGRTRGREPETTPPWRAEGVARRIAELVAALGRKPSPRDLERIRAEAEADLEGVFLTDGTWVAPGYEDVRF